MTEKQLLDLLHEMTLKEKVDQMLQITGSFYQKDANEVLTGPENKLGLTAEDLRYAGSILGTAGAERLKKIQERYLETQPHKIPMLFMMDIIHGMKTVFPIPLAQGASFNPALSKECAAAAAKEAAVSGLHVTFAPMADLVRDPRWGRVMESTGEDPYLNSLFARAMVEGFQGDDPKEPYRIAACVKHFAAYGAAEAGRDYNTAELSEHTLWESYLPAYRAGIEAGAALVMTSFNTVNGIPASTNRWLMRDILRDELGFDGVLISDFSAIYETIAHGHAKDKADAAQKALEAGVDIDMMSDVYSSNLCRLVEEGAVEEALVDEAVLRILRLKNRLGLFENPYKDADPEGEKRYILCAEHRALARRAATESAVLLKNDGLLPLAPKSSVALIGPYLRSRGMISSWAIAGELSDCVTVEEAAKSVFDPRNTYYADGCPMVSEGTAFAGFREETPCAVSEEKQGEMLREALDAAKQAETVVLLLGEHYLQSGEAASRAMIELPEVQMELFREVYKVNQNIAVALFGGRPLDLREISRKAKAVLEAWLPGTEGGNAVIDLLSGKANPSGKLSMSFPYCVGQVPVHYNMDSTGRPWIPGGQDRCRSRYLDIPNEPLYPFGYGLSYTEFTVSPVVLDRDVLTKDTPLTASVLVKNTGTVPGVEAVQLYIRDEYASVVRPIKELKGFQKVRLAPGEEREIRFTIDEPMLRFHTADNGFSSETGRFTLYVGQDSATENSTCFELA